LVIGFSGSAGRWPAAIGFSPVAYPTPEGLGETLSPATGTVALPETKAVHIRSTKKPANGSIAKFKSR